MRTIYAGLALATLFFGCSLDDLNEDEDGTGGASGSGGNVGGTGTGGTSAGTSGGKAAQGGGSGAGGTTAGTGGAGGAGGKGGAVGAGGAGAGGSGATAGRGGSGGGAGRGGTGSGGKGSAAGGAGASAGGASAGSGTAAGGGSSGSGGSSGGGACVENLGCMPTAPATTGDLAQDCVNRINQFRTECACLPPLERWTEGEDCANQMAEYDSVQDEAHAGFRDDICEAGGSAQNECPGYGSNTQVVSRCLQQMWDEGPPPAGECNGACFQMYGHFINMTNESYNKVACGFFTTADGDVWAVQNFSR